MSTLNYTAAMLKKKTVVALDAIAEEMGIDYEQEFGIPTPKKALVIDAILDKQTELQEEQHTDKNPPLHRELNAAEEREFRQWARTNYKAGQPIDETWHPVVQEECAEINAMDGVEVVQKVAKRISKKKQAAKAEVKTTVKKVVELELEDVFCFEGNKKVFQVIKKYQDDKARPHIVVKTEAPTKSQPAEMDLYYKNHLEMNAVVFTN